MGKVPYSLHTKCPDKLKLFKNSRKFYLTIAASSRIIRHKFKEVLFESQGGATRDRAHQIAVDGYPPQARQAQSLYQNPREHISGIF